MPNHGPIIDDDTSSDDSVGGSKTHDPAQVLHEIPADPDTELEDTELEDPAPMAHISDSDGASVAETELDESAHAAHASNDDGGHDTQQQQQHQQQPLFQQRQPAEHSYSRSGQEDEEAV